MLSDHGHTTNFGPAARSLGFLPRGGTLTGAAVPVCLPELLTGAEKSVCGIKAFLIDERREFTAPDGTTAVVDCARVAALDITDSPVHVHGETVETYQILAGTGHMLLGDRVLPVAPGTFILIPPGIPHGLCSAHPDQPLRVLMTFAPGLAPIAHPRWRDERILHPQTSTQIANRSPSP